MDDRADLQRVTRLYYQGQIGLDEFLRQEKRLRPRLDIKPEHDEPAAPQKRPNPLPEPRKPDDNGC